ncbi:MAG: SBBP repeat-containing protein [Acidobacteriota bacterium]
MIRGLLFPSLWVLACLVVSGSKVDGADAASAAVTSDATVHAGGVSTAVLARELWARGGAYFEPLYLNSVEGQAFAARLGGDVAYFLGGARVVIPAMAKHYEADVAVSSCGSAKRSQTLGALAIAFENASPFSRPVGLDLLPGTSNRLLGNEPQRWARDVPHYGRIRYAAVYPGIDVEFYFSNGHLEYDVRLASGAALKDAVLRFDGAQELRIDAQGNLLALVQGWSLRQDKPVAFVRRDGELRVIPARHTFHSRNRIGFELPEHDPSRPAVIDPLLSFVNRLPASANGVALDKHGNAYVTGETSSTSFPLRHAIKGLGRSTSGRLADSDAFVTKYDSCGDIVYSTLLLGSAEDRAYGIAVDEEGAAYVAGTTRSVDFPTVSALQPTMPLRQYMSAFLTKIDASGSTIRYSTYLGGWSECFVRGVAVDLEGNAYVAGVFMGTSLDFESTSAASFHPRCNDSAGFLIKLAPDGRLAYSMITGTGLQGVAVGPDLSAYVVGNSRCSSMALANGFQRKNAGREDAVVAKIDPRGERLCFLTYLGGFRDEFAQAIAVDDWGNAYITGSTTSEDFPVVNPLRRRSHTGKNAFVAKVSSQGDRLIYATLLGGLGPDSAKAVAVDQEGNAYVAGFTKSPDFPLRDPVLVAGIAGSTSFLSKLSPDGQDLVFSSYLGTSYEEGGAGVAVSGQGDAIIVGGSYRDATVRKVATTRRALADLAVAQEGPAISSKTLAYGVTVSNHGPDGAGGVVLIDRPPPGYLPCLQPCGENGLVIAASQGECRMDYDLLVCELGVLPVGGTAALHLVFQSPYSFGGVSRVYLRANEGDPHPSNNVSWHEVKPR